MAKIAEYLKQILSARYGRDVRQSIHDAISAINDESTECWATVEKVPETLAIAAVKDTVSGINPTLEMSSDFILTDFNAWGNTEQDTTTGKNIWNGIISEPDIYYKPDGNYGSAANWDVYIVEVTGGKTYTISGISTTSTNTGFLAFEDDTFISFLNDYSNCTITTPSNCNKLKISVRKTEISTFMIEEGTTATDYEPYTNGASPNPDYEQPLRKVVLSEIRTHGKNFIPISEYTTKSSSHTTKEMTPPQLRVGEKYFLRGKTTDGITLNNSNCQILWEDKEGTRFLTSNSSWWNTGVVCNADTLKATRFHVYTVADLAGKTIQIQLEEGGFTDYEPYTESVVTLSNPITLNGINGVRDTLESKKYEEVVFDGSESGWVLSSDNTFRLIVSGFKYRSQNDKNYKCTQLNAITINERATNNPDNSICINSANYVICKATAFTTLDEWKAHLATNNMKVLYELAEPIETPLPDADIEALKNIRTFKGITHVTTDSEVQPDLEVEYVIDTKMYIDKKFEEMQ